jgi:hypothetical protein
MPVADMPLLGVVAMTTASSLAVAAVLSDPR